jgi:ssDNA-binding Zn-finger/Zn-ribbon topoisomerase 1
MATCPKCGSGLNRIQRKRFDRFLSYVFPVKRYLCLNHTCRWTGIKFQWHELPILGKLISKTQS